MDRVARLPLDERDRIALAGTYDNLISRWWALVPRPGRATHPTDPDGSRRLRLWAKIQEARSQLDAIAKEVPCHHQRDAAPGRRTVRFEAPHRGNPQPRRLFSLSRL